MARVCTVCTHVARKAIDAELVAGTPVNGLATRHGLTEAAVRRHNDAHVPTKLAKAHDAAEVAHADTLLDQVKAARHRLETLQRVAEGVVKRAMDTDDLKIALDAIRTAATVSRESRGYLDLLAELEGELDRRAQVNVLIANPEWVTMRTTILTVLQAHPEARHAVVRALGKVDASAAA